MAEDSDGIEEAAEAQIRVLVTAAGHLGEHLARAREQALRRAEAASQTEARRTRSHYEAEHRLARAELAAVYRADWWEHATPLEVAHAYEVARTWSGEDPEAVRAEQRITDEIRTRYGVTPDDLRAQAQQTQRARDTETTAQAEQAEQAEALLLLAQADHADRAAEETRTQGAHELDPDQRAEARTQAAQHQQHADATASDAALAWDSAERRQATAEDLENNGVDPEIVDTLMHADVSQAQPATEATARSPVRPPRARRSPSRGRPQAQRPEPGR